MDSRGAPQFSDFLNFNFRLKNCSETARRVWGAAKGSQFYDFPIFTSGKKGLRTTRSLFRNFSILTFGQKLLGAQPRGAVKKLQFRDFITLRSEIPGGGSISGNISDHPPTGHTRHIS